MQVRILDLDGSVTQQDGLIAEHQPEVIPARDWGPCIRLACSFGRFQRFERYLARHLGNREQAPAVTFCGSGDFHHVSLALLHRLTEPCNLLIIDNHPDWMRGVPFLHCGTWVYHAARSPLVQQIFHVGGDVDFDNYYQPLTPWPWLCAGKIRVFPSVRRFKRSSWTRIPNEPLRLGAEDHLQPDHLDELLRPFEAELASRPLYISLDKDVMRGDQAVVNWDSGHLTLDEVGLVVRSFMDLAHGRLAGMDIVGDWSPVQVTGCLRRFLHVTEHPSLSIVPVLANQRNQATNLELLETIFASLANKSSPALF